MSTYKTGVTKHFRLTGNISLKYCNNISASSPVNGWQSSGGVFHIFGNDNYHSIQIGAGFGGTLEIKTQEKKSTDSPAPGGSTGSHWATTITFIDTSIDIISYWVNDADPTINTSYNPPDTVSVYFDVSFSTEEWAIEAYLDGLLGPYSSHDIGRILKLKPTTDVTWNMIWAGGNGVGTGHSSKTTPVLIDIDGYLGEGLLDDFFVANSYFISVGTTCNEPNFHGRPDGFDVDLPYVDGKAEFASANGFSFTDELRWAGSDGGNFTNIIDNHTYGDFKKSDLALIHEGFNFKASIPLIGAPPQFNSVYTVPVYKTLLSGRIRDWTHDINGIPIAFIFRGETVIIIADVHTFSPGSSYLLHSNPYHPELDSTWLPLHGYSSADTDSCFYKDGLPWDSLRLDKSKSLKVLDFAVTPTGLPWVLTDCAEIIDGTTEKFTSSGANPKLERDFQNDLKDIEAMTAVAWFTAYAAEIPAFVNTWYNNGGEWNRIGKKLRPSSDYWNWANFRYAELTGKADAACDIHLKIHFDFIEPVLDTFDNPIINHGSATTDYIVHLTTSLSSVEIDLPGGVLNVNGDLVGHEGLRFITKIEVTFPTGRTIYLQDIVLKSKEAALVDIHPADNDTSIISATADGKDCLTFSIRSSNYPSSTWGFPVKQHYTVPFGYYASELMPQLITELNLQEGWSASSPGGVATEHSEDWVIFLEECFQVQLPAIFQSKRCYRDYYAYPGKYESLEVRNNIGNAVKVLVFDLSTHLPVSTPVALETPPAGAPWASISVIPDGAHLHSGNSDSKGILLIPNEYQGGVELKTNSGVSQFIFPIPIYDAILLGYVTNPATVTNRTIWYAAMAGRGNSVSGTGGNPVIDCDLLGNVWVAFINSDGIITIARQLGVETDFTYFSTGAIASGNISIDNNAKEPKNPVYVAFYLTGTIYLGYSFDNGENWRLKLTAISATSPFIRFNTQWELLCMTYCRGGNVYFNSSSDNGNTWTNEVLIFAGADKEYSFTWLHDTKKTIVIPYIDGGGLVQLKKSEDNGDTWI